MKKTKYHVHMSNTSVLLIFFSVLLYKEDICIAVIASLFIHELAHMAVCRLLKVNIAHVHIHPHGINMCLNTMLTPKKQFAVSVSGPLVSLAVSIIFNILFHIVGYRIFNLWSSVNFLMFAVNTIPAFPLDGGEMLRAMLCFFRGYIESVNIVKKLSVYVLTGFMLFGIIIAIMGNFNLSLSLFCVVGLFKLSDCIVYKYNSVMNIMSGNFVSNKKRFRTVYMCETQNLLSAVKYMSTEYTLDIKIFNTYGEYVKTLTQEEFLEKVLN